MVLFTARLTLPADHDLIDGEPSMICFKNLTPPLSTFTLISVTMFLTPLEILAQVPIPVGKPSAQVASVAKSSKWTKPRLPDGRPDLEGYWTNNTSTPLQRPAGVGEFRDRQAPAGRGGQAAQNRNRPFPDLFGIQAGG